MGSKYVDTSSEAYPTEHTRTLDLASSNSEGLSVRFVVCIPGWDPGASLFDHVKTYGNRWPRHHTKEAQRVSVHGQDGHNPDWVQLQRGQTIMDNTMLYNNASLGEQSRETSISVQARCSLRMSNGCSCTTFPVHSNDCLFPQLQSQPHGWVFSRIIAGPGSSLYFSQMRLYCKLMCEQFRLWTIWSEWSH